MGIGGFFNFFLGVVAGVAAYFISGMNPFVGLLVFSLVSGIASYINPIQPDIESPGQPQIGELRLSTAQEGMIIPDALGTIKCTGNIFYYFGDNNVELTEEIPGGKGGGDSGSFVTGYKYYLSWCVGLCLGPIDTLYSIFAGDTIVWTGEQERPASGWVNLPLGNLEPELEEKELTVNYGISILCSHSSSVIKIVTVIPNPWLDSTGPLGDRYEVEFVEATITADWYDIGTDEFITKRVAIVNNHTHAAFGEGLCSAFAMSTCYVNLDPFVGAPGTYYKNESLNITWSNSYDVSEQSTAMGTMTLYFGTVDQPANPTIGASLADPAMNPAYRGLCYAFFNNNYIGRNNSCPTMRFVFRKAPTYGFSALETIQTYDYNIAHAVYHILADDMHLGLDPSYINNPSFAQVAQTLSGENRGISALLEQQRSASTYIEGFLSHMGGMLRSSSDE
jgi:hypothetical protein